MTRRIAMLAFSLALFVGAGVYATNNTKQTCSCGDQCKCNPCKCGKECKCGADCKCGDKCGEHCKRPVKK
ncbi:MAG TPA: hypothetical protein PLZ95_00480 [Bryobacteraceae bacterium]|nr:hypothetical protein [Bryobacteraceae bacterium]